MDEVKQILNEVIDDKLNRIILSNPKNMEYGKKVKIRAVLIQGKLVFQETLYKGNKVFHENRTAEETINHILLHLGDNFRQAEIITWEYMVTVLISKKGKVTIKKKQLHGNKDDNGSFIQKEDRHKLLAHNRSKHYILEEGIPVDFLVGLGVQTQDGKITKAKYDKFRQINRYLEFIEDVIIKLPKDRPVRIIDFGCGKSYLTFAMYYYLHVLQKYQVNITGLDLKDDVIELCNGLAEKYRYDQLHFEKGDISTYEGGDEIDMVVTLHACDTATDYALDKAVKWGAKVIMAVPCCQHEVNSQIYNRELAPILKYGLIKERMASLITDGVRAQLLEEMGYETQILEFIDMEHTPKNLLIRAIKKDGLRPKVGNVRKTTEFLHIETTLQKLLKEDGE